MVMHARKPQRISDGYFEKHQTHPYQNSKYSSSKGNYSERFNERLRASPNGNSYRSDSPDPSSPRDRAYQNKLYMQKMRDKERENRDYNTSRDKYSECSRSPKDKRRDSDRSNHERVGGEERIQRVGDWSEHISSSGKKYYYNCKTEVSQWEKPREWIERERRHAKESDPRYLSRLGHEKHSAGRAAPTSRESAGQVSATRESSRDTTKPPSWSRVDGDDMDISPSSTPRSDPTPAQSVPGTSSAAVTTATSVATVSSAITPVVVAPMTVPPPVLVAVASASVKPEEMPQLSVELPPPGQTDCGPPTPTHSENQDGADPRKQGSPVGAGVSSSLLALRPTAPHLTPSLGNYYREELTNHIRNWPVHAIEKQVLKLSEETHNLTSIHCTRVSAELKTARAIVRLTEIQATLQEQRILFLRQQIKTLEELNTQHSFMGD